MDGANACQWVIIYTNTTSVGNMQRDCDNEEDHDDPELKYWTENHATRQRSWGRTSARGKKASREAIWQRVSQPTISQEFVGHQKGLDIDLVPDTAVNTGNLYSQARISRTRGAFNSLDQQSITQRNCFGGGYSVAFAV